MEALKKFLIRDANGTPTHVAKVYQDSDADHLHDNDSYGCGIITNYQNSRNMPQYMKQEDCNSRVYCDDMPSESDIDEIAICDLMHNHVSGITFDCWHDFRNYYMDEHEQGDDETGAEYEAKMEKAHQLLAEETIAEHGIVWDTYEGNYRDACTWVVFSTAKMREAGNIEHDKAKDIVASHIKVLRQINEGEVYGYGVYELTPIEVPEGFEDIVEDSDLCIEHDDVWYKMGEPDECWGFVGYESHEQAIKDGFLPCGEYKFSTLK